MSQYTVDIKATIRVHVNGEDNDAAFNVAAKTLRDALERYFDDAEVYSIRHFGSFETPKASDR